MTGLLHGLLEEAAASHGDRPAVVDGDRALTYAELAAAAGRVARLLGELGVGRGDRVGLLLEKQAEAVAGLYGVLAAGAAYVPLDPQAPTARSGAIAADCGVSVLLTAGAKAAAVAELAAAGAPLRAAAVLDGAEAPDAAGVRVAPRAELDALPGTLPPFRSRADDLAYLLYTSGSTGAPKGVMLTHGGALAFVDWAAAHFRVSPADRLSSHAPLHFDLSVFDLFAAAKAGATLVLVPQVVSMFPRELARFVAASAISVWYSVPTVLAMLALRGGLRRGDLPSLRAVLFAGEVFPAKHLVRLMELLPQASFHNLYGPTETNVCTCYDLPRPLTEEAAGRLPIGAAVSGDEVFAVTDGGRVAAPGEAGELHVAGPTVMRGYWGDAERTARALVPDPRPGAAGLAYRTGDLARAGSDGNWLFLGRRDGQVKSRGYRIELGEVESRLVAHPAVVECAVVAVPDELVTSRLRAFVSLRADVPPSELTRFCAERLPAYMVPEAFERRGALPRTSTGKVDRRALLEEALSAPAGGGGTRPRTRGSRR